ncbi:hypothetical protein [Xenorhabdus hominickii]|nr:hypothetical protein [Xenorhabdus hominickii]
MTEQRPHMQAHPMVLNLKKRETVIFTVRRRKQKRLSR